MSTVYIIQFTNDDDSPILLCPFRGKGGTSAPNEAGSLGSKGVVSPMEPLRGRVHRVQKVQRVQRVVDCPAGNAYKVSVTGLPFCHISRSKHGGESATSGGFSPFGAYGTTFPPQKRGHNKAPYSIPLISGSKVSTGCCPTACGGKVVAPATKGGAAFPSPAKAVVKVL